MGNDYTTCKITRFPEPVLGKTAKEITVFDASLRALVERMKDIMVEQKGIGLAGPQAGVDLQIFVVSLDGTKEGATVYINPKIELSGPLDENEEGCLSIPGIYAKIKRYACCTVHAVDLDGNPFTETGHGLLARAFQHEYDHLQGILIKDRMTQAAKLRARRRLGQLQEEYDNKNADS